MTRNAEVPAAGGPEAVSKAPVSFHPPLQEAAHCSPFPAGAAASPAYRLWAARARMKGSSLALQLAIAGAGVGGVLYGRLRRWWVVVQRAFG